MIVGLVGALSAAVFFGVASVLQARGARAVPATGRIDPHGLLRVARQWPYLLGLVCDLAGFLAELTALRELPLFAVQAAVASSLAVTAIATAVLLGARLTHQEWIAVLAVCVGLAALGLSAGAEGARVDPRFRWGLAAATVVLVGAGLAAGRVRRGRCLLLGAVGGLGFGVVAVAARIVTGFSPRELVTDPAAYLMVVGGVVGFVCYTTALQSGPVTTATAGLVVGETVLPALIGVLLLGDGTRAGFAPVAVGGFLLAVAGALSLGRFGEPAQA